MAQPLHIDGVDRGTHLASSPWRIRQMCPDTLIGGHGSGHLTSAHLSTIGEHDLVYAAWCSGLCIWSASPAIVMCRHLRLLAVKVRLHGQFCLTHPINTRPINRLSPEKLAV